jgi:DNA-binding CsgD family transcriptional regulator
MLTQRELEVLRLLGAGSSTADIAGTLNITRVTARNHVNKVLDKLGANSRLQAVVIASQLRLI